MFYLTICAFFIFAFVCGIPTKKIHLWNKKLEAGEKERDTGRAERGEGGEDKGRVNVGDWRGEG